jgi:hypothetical protein
MWEKLIVTAIIAATLPFGITVMVIGKSVYSIIALFINSHFSGKFIQYPLLQQLKDISAVLLLSVFVGTAVWIINLQLNGMSDWCRILTICGISGTLYFGLSHLLRISPYLFIKHIIFEKFIRFSKA